MKMILTCWTFTKNKKKGGREDAHLKRHRGSKVNEQMEATLTPACGNNFINLFFSLFVTHHICFKISQYVLELILTFDGHV